MVDGRRIRQVILVRKDLNMRKGKIGAQVAHASMKVFFDRGFVTHEILVSDYDDSAVTDVGEPSMIIPLTAEMEFWAVNSFGKIVRYVTSEQELLASYEKAKEAGLPCALIQDSGHTEFHGIPTYTTVAVGPAEADAIDEVIGRHPLY